MSEIIERLRVGAFQPTVQKLLAWKTAKMLPGVIRNPEGHRENSSSDLNAPQEEAPVLSEAMQLSESVPAAEAAAQPDAQETVKPEVVQEIVPADAPQEQSLREKIRRVFNTIRIASLVLMLLIVIGLFVFMGVWIYRRHHFEMFGQPIETSAEELRFSGDEITSYDALCSYLPRFHNLKQLNLGSFPLEAENVSSLEAMLPETQLIYHKVVRINGVDFAADSETIDISEKGYSDVNEFMQKLDYLPNLKTVLFGKRTIPQSQKELLCDAFPEISFEVIGTYEIFGKTVLENAEKLDLRDVQLDASLCDQLALLPQLRRVNLHDQKLTKEERIALVKNFPDISFGWKVSYDGEIYDSDVTELDVSGKHMEDEENLNALREAISQLPNLTKVVMCDCHLGNEDMAKFREEIWKATNKKCEVVWRLYLGCRWSLRTDAEAFSVLIVHYDYPRMGSKDIEVLKYTTHLKALDLGHQRLTDLTFIGEYLTDLRLLILADNAISDLSPLANLKHLHYLEVFLNRISDVSPLKACKELVDLNISYNPISDVEPLTYAPMMERLWMESTYVGNNGYGLLREAYPDAKIVRYGSGSVDQGWRWGHPRYEQMMDMWFHDYYGDEFSKFDDLAVELGLR